MQLDARESESTVIPREAIRRIGRRAIP